MLFKLSLAGRDTAGEANITAETLSESQLGSTRQYLLLMRLHMLHLLLCSIVSDQRFLGSKRV